MMESFIIGAIVSLIVGEIFDWAGPIARKFIKSNIKRAPEDIRDRLYEELLSELDRIPGRCSKFIFALTTLPLRWAFKISSNQKAEPTFVPQDAKEEALSVSPCTAGHERRDDQAKANASDERKPKLRKVKDGWLVLLNGHKLGRVEKRVVSESPKVEMWVSIPMRGIAQVAIHRIRSEAVRQLMNIRPDPDRYKKGSRSTER